MILRKVIVRAAVVALCASSALAAGGGRRGGAPPPTHEDVKYDTKHKRNVLDFWQAKSGRPTPVVVWFHGGGFKKNDKADIRRQNPTVINEFLKLGVSFASCNYPFLEDASYFEIMRHCARAIQFLRSKQKDWNVDPRRIGAFGASAGALISEWIAYHGDVANRRSRDRVDWFSSSLAAVGGLMQPMGTDYFVMPQMRRGGAAAVPLHELSAVGQYPPSEVRQDYQGKGRQARHTGGAVRRQQERHPAAAGGRERAQRAAQVLLQTPRREVPGEEVGALDVGSRRASPDEAAWERGPMGRIRAWLLALCGASLCAFAARGAAAAEPKEKRILFIGNSYTGGMRAEFGKLIRSEKVKAGVEYICPGGRTLLQHSENPKVAEKIRSRKWDYVVLQEQSQTPAYFRDRFRKGAEALNRVISENGSKAVFYMTWGRRDGDKRNRSRAPDYETMQKLLTESYQAVGRELGIRVAPVGRAWQEVRKKDRDLWKAFYRKDGSHPSAKGAYLISLVFHCVLFDLKPADVRHNGALKPEEASVVREAAAEVLKD